MQKRPFLVTDKGVFMKKLILILLMLSGQSDHTDAQSDLSHLVEELRSATNDTTRVNAYYAISRFYWTKNADSSLLMAQAGLDLATEINYKKGMAINLLTKGVILVSKGKYPEALECHFKALRISEELKLDGLTANSHNNVGIVYLSMGNTEKALGYFKKSLEHAAQNEDRRAILITYINIAEIYVKDEKLDEALEHDMKALTFANELKAEDYRAIVLFNIGDIYRKKEDHPKALTYLREALALSEKINDLEGVAYCYNSMAQTFEKTGQLNKSIQYAEMGLEKARTQGHTELIKSAYSILHAAYSRYGSFEKALYYRNLEIGLKDSMFTIEKERMVHSLQSSYDLAQKQHEIDLLNKNEIIHQAEMKRETFRRLAFTAAALLLAFASLFLIWTNTLKRKKNHLLKRQNEEITRQKMAITHQHARIHEQNKLLEKSNAIKNRLFSIVSHDLRSPLHSLQGIVSLMEIRSLSEEETKKINSMITQQVNATMHLLDNLLNWAKNQMEGLQVNIRQFDVQHTIAENIRLLQASADNKNVGLRNEVAESIMAKADAAMIDIVIRNLIGNAIKFSKADDVVSVTAIAGGKFAKVIVRDTGLGIPLENQSKIFTGSDPFTTPGTSNEKGTGLGLSLCKELVEKNGGRIWFESRPREGSAFMFTIPL